MQFPQVNINGTSRGALIQQLTDAYSALTDAISALSAMSPHGRDYQTLPDGSWLTARKEHDARIEAVVKVRDEIAAIFESIDA